MAEYFNGTIFQIDQADGQLTWHPHDKNFSGNDVAFSSLTEVDLTLNTTRYQLCCPIESTEPYVVDGKTYMVGQDEFLILNQGQLARAEGRSSQPMKGICFLLSPCLLNEIFHHSKDNNFTFNMDDLTSSPTFHVQHHKLQNNALGQLLKGLKYRFFNSDRTVLIDWEDFFYQLGEAFVNHFNHEMFQLQRLNQVSQRNARFILKKMSIARSYLQDSLHAEISLDDLSRQCLISKYQLIRLYKLVYGITPYQHLLKMKIEKAQVYFRQEYSISETAKKLSFSNRRTFTKAFKRLTGQSPTDYLLKS